MFLEKRCIWFEVIFLYHARLLPSFTSSDSPPPSFRAPGPSFHPAALPRGCMRRRVRPQPQQPPHLHRQRLRRLPNGAPPQRVGGSRRLHRLLSFNQPVSTVGVVQLSDCVRLKPQPALYTYNFFDLALYFFSSCKKI